jgi:hypothetical protein
MVHCLHVIVILVTGTHRVLHLLILQLHIFYCLSVGCIFCHVLLCWEIKNLLKLKSTIVHVSVLTAASFLTIKDWVGFSF